MKHTLVFTGDVETIQNSRTHSATLRMSADGDASLQPSTHLPDSFQAEVIWHEDLDKDCIVTFTYSSSERPPMTGMTPTIITAFRHASPFSGIASLSKSCLLSPTLRKYRFKARDFGWPEYLVGNGRHATISLFLTVVSNPPAQATAKPDLSLLHCYTTNDVVFIFPFESTPRYLWANIAALSNVSPVFAAMFTGGFSEQENGLDGVKEWSEQCKASIESIIQGARKGERPPDIMEDSDTEEESLNVRLDGKPQAGDKGGGLGTLRYVVVKTWPYRTYEAVLAWILDGRISFARLTSASRADEAKTSASPKSVYRLAHHLELMDLANIALAEFRNQLDADNVLTELFSTICTVYPALKAAALAVLQEEWTAIKEKGKLADLQNMLGEGQGLEDAEAAKLLVELLSYCDKLNVAKHM